MGALVRTKRPHHPQWVSIFSFFFIFFLYIPIHWCAILCVGYYLQAHARQTLSGVWNRSSRSTSSRSFFNLALYFCPQENRNSIGDVYCCMLSVRWINSNICHRCLLRVVVSYYLYSQRPNYEHKACPSDNHAAFRALSKGRTSSAERLFTLLAFSPFLILPEFDDLLFLVWFSDTKCMFPKKAHIADFCNYPPSLHEVDVTRLNWMYCTALWPPPHTT